MHIFLVLPANLIQNDVKKSNHFVALETSAHLFYRDSSEFANISGRGIVLLEVSAC